MGIKILEMTSAQLLQDIEEFIDQQMEEQLQRAKFQGLAAVENLLQTSLGDSSKDIYYFFMETTKEGLNDVLTGKIRKVYLIPKHIQLFSEPLKKTYKLLIKAIPPMDKSVSKLFILDSFFIN